MMRINEQKFTITSAEENDSGDYHCWTGTGVFSYPARLYVHSKGSAVRPVMTFTPNWREIFPGETVTLTCDVGSTAQGTQRYYWYKNKEKINKDQNQHITIINAAEMDSGDYQCSAGTEDLSYPVRLDVNSYASLILQAPPYIFEGDPLTLRCHSRPTYQDEVETYFHTDNKYAQPKQNILYIPSVNASMAGIYQCTKKVAINDIMDETFIFVQELFSYPEIKIIPDTIIGGDDMTLRCNTTLAPLRDTTELQFAFYRDGRIVQEFSVSDTYRVSSAQLEDSGNYTCDVRTSTGSVRKTSDVSYIQIHIKQGFTSPKTFCEVPNVVAQKTQQI
ncbi:Fc receptor-like protein 4 [Mixophyes fleayi]|uniref:Fc receptor-like protein 4 n=1 Tax=Mixophyes fleayi TaxID=3061075 RepID=UPI003F4E3CCA